jgi:hypothetical protein
MAEGGEAGEAGATPGIASVEPPNSGRAAHSLSLVALRRRD